MRLLVGSIDELFVSDRLKREVEGWNNCKRCPVAKEYPPICIAHCI